MEQQERTVEDLDGLEAETGQARVASVTEQSAFFRIIALSNAAIRRLAVYLGGIALFLYGLTKLQPVVEKLFPHSPPWMVLPVAALPLLFVAGFELIPTSVARYKAGRLKTIGISVNQDISAYFRISAYDDTIQDRQAFQRADHVHDRVLIWIKSTAQPILYLTGRSGTGKTSLMNAFVLPELRSSAEILPIAVRSIDAPLAQLRSFLLQPGLIWKEPVEKPNEDLFALMLRSSDRIGKRLLLLFDQFEEILIETSPDKRVLETKDFIRFLAAKRDPRIITLISIRDDYLGPLEEMGLPRLTQQANWLNISAFTEQASRDFLSRSGLIIKPTLLESITTQARVIEDVTGLIRPVTLNMIGLVLSVNSRASEGDTVSKRDLQKMIVGYIKDSIFRSDIKPFATKIVQQMYTKEGLKKPITVREISDRTKFSPDVVFRTLLLVSARGLVQRLGSAGTTWQISHDFVAKLFRDAISDWTTQLARAGVLVAPPLLLLTWLVLLLSVVPQFQEQRLVDLVAQTGGTAQVTDGQLQVNVGIQTSNLAQLMQALGKSQRLSQLDLSQTRVTDDMLAKIADSPHLTLLDLNDTKIGDASADYIGRMIHLRELRLRGTKITNVGLRRLDGLRDLRIIILGGTHITDEGFAPISHLPELRQVFINYTGVSAGGIEGLVDATHLQILEMNSTAASDANIANIARLKSLTSLALAGTKITAAGICQLGPLVNLRTIDLSGDHLPAGVAKCLATMSHLSDINLSQSDFDDQDAAFISRLTDLDNLTAKETKITDLGLLYLEKLTKLTAISVPVTQVTDAGMASLAHIQSLREVYVGGTSVSDMGVKKLSDLPDLRVLFLRGCKGVTDSSMPDIYRMANLQTISLESTSITSEAIDSLMKARPDLQVNSD